MGLFQQTGLEADPLQHRRRVPIACGDPRRECVRQAAQLLGGEADLCGLGILLEIRHAFRARNGNDVDPLRQHLREGDLRRRAPFYQGKLIQGVE